MHFPRAACGFTPAPWAQEIMLSITFCHPQSPGPGRTAACSSPESGQHLSLRGLQHFKEAKWPVRTQGPLLVPCGRTQQYWTECPAFEILIYSPSPQVQRAVPGPTSWADISPLLRIQAAGREPAPLILPLNYYLSCPLLSALTSSCHLCVYCQ